MTDCAAPGAKETLVSGGVYSKQELNELKAAYPKVFSSQHTQFGKTISYLNFCLLTQPNHLLGINGILLVNQI